MASAAPEQPSPSFRKLVASWRDWWWRDVLGTVDQAAVIETRRADSAISARYLFMLAMSAGIAILGLLLSSPAVVIGAMLLSPLMGPIIGLGFALAIGDFHWTRQAARSLVIGTLVAVPLCALVALLSPLQTVTTEIVAFSKPNLFDLLVALFAALAGAYAMIRGREGTIVGVAIATALMPPLAVIGFGLATLNWTVFSGALLLFITNLMTIALTAAVMARFYGFRTSLSEQQTRLQTVLIAAAFVALAIPLFLSLRQIAWEATSTRQINAAVLGAFDSRARLSQVDIAFDAEPIQVAVTVLTPQLRPEAERTAARTISRELGTPAEVSITQYRVGTSETAVELAALSAARAREDGAALQRSEELGRRLALIAGVSEADVLVDRERRRALVAARPFEGAPLAVYRELERRISATEPEWEIALRPPARPLPAIPFEDGEPTDQGEQALNLIAWAGQRLPAPIILSGPEDAVAIAAERLRSQGVAIRTQPGGAGPISAAWGAPDS